MTQQLDDTQRDALVRLLLATADDKLLLGHRNSDWTGLAPMLEEDIAFSSMAQDEIAHALALYELVGTLTDQNADDIAFGRSAEEYRSAAIVEAPDEFDWAIALTRRLLCDHFDLLRLERMSGSNFKPLAAMAKRLVREESLHVEYITSWYARLGAHLPSRQRLQKALDRLAPQAGMLFEPTCGQASLASAGVYPGCPAEMFDRYTSALVGVGAAANVHIHISRPDPSIPGGRHGHHSEHLEPLLDEMCEVYRVAPGAPW